MRTEAQKRADKKFRELGRDKYKNLSTVIHVDNVEKIKKVALNSGLTLSKYIARAVFYCVNNNIDLSEYDEKLRDPDDSKDDK